MFLRIEMEEAEQIDVEGLEMLVYSTLRYLCRNKPWQGTMTDLAKKSRCGGRLTAKRKLDSLIAKGYVQLTEYGYTCVQNEHLNVQNEHLNVQNEHFSKEKRSKKENIKENNEVSGENARVRIPPTASPIEEVINNLFDMNTLIPADRAKVPANTGYYKIIVTEFGYMRPKEFVDDFYLHYNAHGWPNGGNKLDLMRFWMTRYVRRRGTKKPSLSDLERAVMKTFLEQIEERLIVRLFHVVQQFEVTEQKIIFYVPEQNKKDFTAWLESLPLFRMLEAYHRTVYVK
ncbi:MAG: hypothetical protein MJZ64_04285 [Paludibacteraceae bacterium]|nr:hypothetical protein [Paludibacteraceae bacterium]